MIRNVIVIALLALSAYATPATAQTAKQLNIDVSSGWTHEQSGLSFPATINNQPFWRAIQYTDGGWDNSLQYNDPNLSEIISVYIYQAAMQDVGLLFAESRRPLEIRKDVYGNVTPLAEPAAFTPPGQRGNSGLRITYETDAAYRSTALAIAPLGRDWIVKFRVSSKTKSASELDAILSAAISAITWPKDDRSHPAATAMKDCTDALPEFKKKAKPVKNDGGNAILNAVLAGMMSDKNKDTLEVPLDNISHCRDRSTNIDYSIYRPNAATDRYLVSLGDSGRAIFVEPDTASMLLGDSKKDGTAYTIRFVGPGSVEIYPTHNRMPSPQQALEIIDNMAPVTRTGRDGKSEVQIDASALD